MDYTQYELDVAREYLGRIQRLIVDAQQQGRDSVPLSEVIACVSPTAAQEAELHREMDEAIAALGDKAAQK